MLPFRSRSRSRPRSREAAAPTAGLTELDGPQVGAKKTSSSPFPSSPLRIGRSRSSASPSKRGRVRLGDGDTDEHMMQTHKQPSRNTHTGIAKEGGVFDEQMEQRIAQSRSQGKTSGGDTGMAAKGKKSRWPSLSRSKAKKTDAAESADLQSSLGLDAASSKMQRTARKAAQMAESRAEERRWQQQQQQQQNTGLTQPPPRTERTDEAELDRAVNEVVQGNGRPSLDAFPSSSSGTSSEEEQEGVAASSSDYDSDGNTLYRDRIHVTDDPAGSFGAAATAAATTAATTTKLSREELRDLERTIPRTRSRDAVMKQGSLLAQMQRQAQLQERRNRSFTSTGSGTGGFDQQEGGAEHVNVGGALSLRGLDVQDSREHSNRGQLKKELSSPARRAADAAASLMSRSRSRGLGVFSERGLEDFDNFADLGHFNLEDDHLLAFGNGAHGQSESEHQHQHLAVLRAVLARPSGTRTSLPPVARRFIVKVAPAEFDRRAQIYRYPITIVTAQGISATADGASSSLLPPAKTARSLPDFVFLDNYLRAEFAGATLPPLLSVTLYGRYLLGVKDGCATDDDGDGSINTAGTFDTLQPVGPVRTVSDLARRCQERLEQDMDRNVPISEDKLASWLSDILNGVRGEGEWLMLPKRSKSSGEKPVGPVNIANSEALETFLYRNTDSLPATAMMQGVDNGSSKSRISCLAIALNSPDASDEDGIRRGDTRPNTLETLLSRPLACLDQRCGGDMPNAQSNGTRWKPFSPKSRSGDELPVGIPPYASPSRIAQSLELRSTLLTAQRDLITTYRRHATRTIHRLKILQGDETRMAVAWKRFAISLSNLFAFEKDLESANFGGDAPKRRMQEDHKKKSHGKLSKSTIDNGLRVLAKRKQERTGPGLDIIGEMMVNYLGDLVSVDPCLVEYGRAAKLFNDPLTRLFNGAGCTADTGPVWRQESAKAVAAIKSAASSLAKRKGQALSSPPEPSLDSSSLEERAERLRLMYHEQILETEVTSLCRSASIRSARTASQYLQAESNQASNLRAGSMALHANLYLNPETEASIAYRSSRHAREEKEDRAIELEIIRRMFGLVQNETTPGDEDGSLIAEEMLARDENCSRVLLLATDRVGRWNGELSLALMECSGVEDAEVRVEETTRDLRLVRKYAIGLRENVERCAEAVGMLNGVVLGADTGGGDDSSLDTSIQSTLSNISSSTSYEAVKINRKRELFLSSFARSLSCTPVPGEADEIQREKAEMSRRILEEAGIDLSDAPGWLAASEIIESGQQHRHRNGKCGELLISYQQVRDADVAVLLARINQHLADYHRRVEMIESFVYMHCVGIQLEKHYSKLRSEALAEWENKTDITTAINIATKKNLPALVEELTAKLESLPTRISHMSVKKAKRKHLLSKAIKDDLQRLAERRFQRARDTSTERVIAMIQMWTQHEESVTHDEIKIIGELINEIERHITRHTIEGDQGASLLAVATATRDR